MDKQAVAEVLDQAIVAVAKKDIRRLCEAKEWNVIEIARSIQNALETLRNLQSGVMPDYKEWVALFYLLWYQPKQINLAYSLIERATTQKPAREVFPHEHGKLHLVDFGCGALAMQFAVALSVADALENGKDISSIRTDSIDCSEPMIQLGQAVWEEFTHLVEERCVNDDDRFGNLYLALTSIESSTYSGTNPSIDRDADADCWLSALHAVYESNLNPLRDTLGRLKNQLNPEIGFVTSHYFKEYFIRSVSPFEGDSRYRKYAFNNFIEHKFQGELPYITGFRESLHRSIFQRQGNPDLSRYGVNLDFVKNYLNNPVTWEWPRASSLVYARR